ncbi:hypothetical protein OSTOST_05237 [Ostertagia ostertagi]
MDSGYREVEDEVGRQTYTVGDKCGSFVVMPQTLDKAIAVQVLSDTSVYEESTLAAFESVCRKVKNVITSIVKKRMSSEMAKRLHGMVPVVPTLYNLVKTHKIPSTAHIMSLQLNELAAPFYQRKQEHQAPLLSGGREALEGTPPPLLGASPLNGAPLKGGARAPPGEVAAVIASEAIPAVAPVTAVVAAAEVPGVAAVVASGVAAVIASETIPAVAPVTAVVAAAEVPGVAPVVASGVAAMVSSKAVPAVAPLETAVVGAAGVFGVTVAVVRDVASAVILGVAAVVASGVAAVIASEDNSCGGSSDRGGGCCGGSWCGSCGGLRVAAIVASEATFTVDPMVTAVVAAAVVSGMTRVVAPLVAAMFNVPLYQHKEEHQHHHRHREEHRLREEEHRLQEERRLREEEHHLREEEHHLREEEHQLIEKALDSRPNQLQVVIAEQIQWTNAGLAYLESDSLANNR